jgi:hypothetical protein
MLQYGGRKPGRLGVNRSENNIVVKKGKQKVSKFHRDRYPPTHVSKQAKSTAGFCPLPLLCGEPRTFLFKILYEYFEVERTLTFENRSCLISYPYTVFLQRAEGSNHS